MFPEKSWLGPISFICHLAKLCSCFGGYETSVTMEEYIQRLLPFFIVLMTSPIHIEPKKIPKYAFTVLEVIKLAIKLHSYKVTVTILCCCTA